MVAAAREFATEVRQNAQVSGESLAKLADLAEAAATERSTAAYSHHDGRKHRDPESDRTIRGRTRAGRSGGFDDLVDEDNLY